MVIEKEKYSPLTKTYRDNQHYFIGAIELARRKAEQQTSEYKIKEKLIDLWRPSFIKGACVYNGIGFSDTFRRWGKGWWLKPIDQKPIYLGENEEAALDFINGFSPPG